MMPESNDDFGFVSFDDLKEDEDEFGFVPFEVNKKPSQEELLPLFSREGEGQTELTNFPEQEQQPEFEEMQMRQVPQEVMPQEQMQEPIENEEDNIFLKSLKQIPENLAGQIGLGLLQGATAPLDLLKTFMLGEALTGLEDAQEASEKQGIPFDMESERKKILENIESIPTQTLAENLLEKRTGVSTKPRNVGQKIARTTAEFLGASPKDLGKDIKLAEKVLPAEQQALRKTGKEFGLRKFAGMETAKPPSVTPIVSPEKEAKLITELGETTKKAIDKIIDQKIPVKKMRDMGIDLETAYETAYETARKTASEMGEKPVDYTNVVNWIDKEISKTKASSPSLSKQQKIQIDILEAERKSLIRKEPKGSTQYDLITGKKLPTPIKKADANQALNQYRNYNDNVKGIYRKPEFSGSENTVKNTYAGLNEQIINAIEKANPKLAKELKFANKIFHETSKLNQVEGIISKSFSDGYNPNKLARSLSSNRERKFLERNLGKDSVQDLERIAKYGQAAEKKVFDELKNPKSVKEYLEKMTPMQLSLLVGYKSHIGLPFIMAKSAINRIQGHIFTRNSTRKDLIKFLKEASQLGKSPAPLFMAAKKLNKSIEEEFGSEQELISNLDKDESD